MSNISMTLAELSQLLDVYGADRTRWPAEMRAVAVVLTARDAEAGRLLAEAEALDRVLERAPVPPLVSEAALAERIVAAAQRSPRIVKLPGAQSAAPGAAPARATVQPAVTAAHDRRRMRLFSREAGAVGVLAASLAFGVVIGSSGIMAQILPALADFASPSSNDLASVQIALSSDEDMQ